jgi:hypothetical protein
MEHMKGTLELFAEHDDLVVENFVNQLSSGDFRVVGAEYILGRIYQKIGYPEDGSCNYFKGLVLCRLVYPGSKLKTIQYFSRHLQLDVSMYTIYRFLDELSSRLKNRIEEHICICFAAYTVYKELERLLEVNQIGISVERAIEEIKEIRQLRYRLPKSKTVKIKLLKPTSIQEKLLNLKF